MQTGLSVDTQELPENVVPVKEDQHLKNDNVENLAYHTLWTYWSFGMNTQTATECQTTKIGFQVSYEFLKEIDASAELFDNVKKVENASNS